MPVKAFVARSFVPGVIAANAGLLAALIFGPNSSRPNGPLFGTGIGVLAIGLACMAVGAYHRKRAASPPLRGDVV